MSKHGELRLNYVIETDPTDQSKQNINLRSISFIDIENKGKMITANITSVNENNEIDTNEELEHIKSFFTGDIHINGESVEIPTTAYKSNEIDGGTSKRRTTARRRKRNRRYRTVSFKLPI